MTIALDSTPRTMANTAVLSNNTPLSVAHYTTVKCSDMTSRGTPESQLQKVFRHTWKGRQLLTDCCCLVFFCADKFGYDRWK